MEKDDEKLTLVFCDDGVPYNPLTNEEPDIHVALEDRAIGGLGIFMVKKMVESADYEYKDHMNKLTLTMKLDA